MAHSLGLEVLLEIHSEDELEYATDCIDLIGVNNRNLGSFHTDVENSFRLAEKLPKGIPHISESGISGAETIIRLRQAGYNGSSWRIIHENCRTGRCTENAHRRTGNKNKIMKFFDAESVTRTCNG